jgi:pimeloyl-ACP methyl ester carboxylesterase
VLSVAVPAVLAAAFLISRLGAYDDLARTCLRGLRYLVAAEFALLILLGLIGFSYERRARKQEAARFHPPGQLVDIGGYRLHPYCTGSGGPTVVLEHGHRATYLDWFRVQPQIATFTRVCSYDRAGYGWSDPSAKDRVPSVMAEELHTLLNAAGEKPPYVLVGHSFGALNAVMFAHKFPDEVAGIVLVDGSRPESLRQIPWRGRLWVLMMRVTIPFGLPRWRGWFEGGWEDVAAEKEALTCRLQFFETITREDSAFPRTAREMNAITSLGDVPLVVIARDPGRGQNPAAETRNNQLQRESAKLSTNSQFVVASGSAHDVPLARPDVIVNAVKSLIRPQAQAGSQGTP